MKKIFLFFMACCFCCNIGYAADASILKPKDVSGFISLVPAAQQAAVTSAYKKINGNYITTTDMAALCDVAFSGDDVAERLNQCAKMVDKILGTNVCLVGEKKIVLGGRCPEVVDAVERVLNGMYLSNNKGGCICYARDCTAGFLAVGGLCLRESEIVNKNGIAPKCLEAWRKYAPANQSFDEFFRGVCKDEKTLNSQIEQWNKQGEQALDVISEDEYKRRRQELAKRGIKTYADFLKSREDLFYLELKRNGCKHYYITSNPKVANMYKAYNDKAAQLWTSYYDTKSLTKEAYNAQLYRLKTSATNQVRNAISREAIERHATKMSSTVVGALKEDKNLFGQAQKFATLSDNDKLAFGSALVKKIAPKFGVRALPVRATDDMKVRGYFSIQSLDIHMNLKAFKDVSAFVATLTHELSHYIDTSCPDEGALGTQLGLFSSVIYATASSAGADSVSKEVAWDTYMHTFTEQSSQRLGWEVEEAVRALFR